MLFLCGVNVGFGRSARCWGARWLQPGYKWLLVPIGMLIGFFIVKAEPAIQVLNRQIQSVTSGAISARAMNRCLSIGVSVSVGLAMLRVVTGIPVAYILRPVTCWRWGFPSSCRRSSWASRSTPAAWPAAGDHDVPAAAEHRRV